MIGNYSIQGRIMMLPIAGKGICSGNYSDIDAVAVMQGEKIQKNGMTYFNVKDFLVDFSIGHATIHLTNLFDGDQQLGDSMNEFLNDNWKSLAEEIKPVLEKTIGDMFKKFSNKIYHKYPLNELLPP
ncbi:unnamed protein product [Nesidiocoris tenuis]|nr:unnamed protein product [Nesidiocoris tenuis]